MDYEVSKSLGKLHITKNSSSTACLVKNEIKSTAVVVPMVPTHTMAYFPEKDPSPEDMVYGELILLGYNGSQESMKTSTHGRKHKSKMTLCIKEDSNGIKRGTTHLFDGPPEECPLVSDSTKYVISYSQDRSKTILVEYVEDPNKDMFQIGRSSENQIDFTIVDTWLAAGTNNGVCSSAANSARSLVKNQLCVSGDANRPISSTISRYACRIITDRLNPGKCYVYAAGFDSRKNIFLGEKATKWSKNEGECDGLTTNGVLILHPNNSSEEDSSGLFTWREISVDGEIHKLRQSRSSNIKGELIESESNQLQDGTIIDLCGATLLWRSADGLANSPSVQKLEEVLDQLNAGKPQCPVNLNTLVIPKKKAKSQTSRQPYVYIECGHVQGKHDWGMSRSSGATVKFKCPICLIESEKVVQLVMGMESAFHLDSSSLDYCFNPCGHMASMNTVRYWAKIPMPHGTTSFHPICPFCSCLLATKKPFLRLIFQDHCYEGNLN
uniref:Protein pellino n=1 Tax=Rhabditophanes sp. KR3021 TaxID=114890 RepID=A0AC35TGJ6_9BILA